MGRRAGSPGSETPNPLSDLYSLAYRVWEVEVMGGKGLPAPELFWRKFFLRNHNDSATPPTTPLELGEGQADLILLRFSENNLENASYARGESGCLEAKMRRLGRQSSPESTEALHHLAYRIEVTPPGKREWEG